LEFKLSLSFTFLFLSLLSQQLHFLEKVSGNLLLVAGHLLFQLLNLVSFLVQLFLNLEENSLAFLALGLLLCDLLKCDSQLLSELGQVLGYLEFLVKRDYAIFVVD